MSGSSHLLAQGFLLVSATVFLFVYALPLFLAPLAWAWWFRWKLPAERDLTTYFGRCLGAVALAMVPLVLRAAFDPVAHHEVFDLLVLLFGSMVVVHVWGAVRRIQPWTEDLEIVFYVGLTVTTLWVRSTVV